MTLPTITETPMQADRAKTIFEKSEPGRRAAQIPDAGVPERPLALGYAFAHTEVEAALRDALR